MFWAPLCPSSGAREYYTSCCCLSYLVLGFQVVGMGPKHVEQAIRSAIKIHLLHLVGILFPHIIDDARSKPHQTTYVPTEQVITAVIQLTFSSYIFWLISSICLLLLSDKPRDSTNPTFIPPPPP